MKTICIPFPEIPQTTRLFETYLTDFDQLAAYFSHPPDENGIAAAARELKLSGEARRQLADILRDQNSGFAASGKLDEKIERNLDRLARGAAAIVTGQQVGLFSGPALTIYKALSAIRCADEMTRRGIDAVPIFWLATTDHDLAEVNESFWSTRGGLARYELPTDPADAGRCVGQIHLGDSVEAMVQSAAQTLDGPGAAEIGHALRESYAPSGTYGSAFGKLLARILAGRGILLLDPQDARFDRLAAPVYRAAIEVTDDLRAALLERSRTLEEAGYHAQVKVGDESTLLFYSVDGRREPLHIHKDGDFSAGSLRLSKAELLAALDKTPEAFTPSALLRPVVQDTMLPTAALIGGPAEIAYLAQSQVVYAKLLRRMPAVLPRASFTLVEPPIGRFLDQYGLDIRDVFRGRQHMRTKMEQKALPDELTRRFDQDEEALRRIVRAYREPLERLDATLVGSVETIEEKIAGMFLKLKEKVGRAENFRSGVIDRHEGILLDSLYVNHELQERHLSALPDLAAHGLQLLDDLLRIMPPPGSSSAADCAGQHHVLFLD
ncbi:MAG TPA: bacillithiol biosynthesis cysteine-adding enzyme BshC [Candidatus Acidoferrales bacterium]|nr:bacillithiol biosynthesis cysteine-adding enzyme BshC [Candidatus Acidoferrales bacterium]